MTEWTSSGPTVLAAFLASLVECVEALTIVLAAGLTRGWRPALLGTAAGLAVLAAGVVGLGSSLQAVPLPVLQVIVGLLLLLFGMRWLHKAVLRGAGVLPLRDERLAFEKETAAMRGGARHGRGVDLVGFLTAFKAVLLEGLEVVFIVVALGTRGGLLVPAAAGAGMALLLVAAVGLLVHAPLAQVPENSLKFAVGAMLTAFGTYWAGEGIGLVWPGQDLAVIGLIALFVLTGLALVKVFARAPAEVSAFPPSSTQSARATQGVLAIAGGELLGLFVEDLGLALCVLAWVAASAAARSYEWVPDPVAAALFTAGLVVILLSCVARRARMPAHALARASTSTEG